MSISWNLKIKIVPSAHNDQCVIGYRLGISIIAFYSPP